MILNFRKPTFVIPGAWNESILNNPGWLGKHVYNYEEGSPVNVLQVCEENPATHLARIILYIENIGFLVERGRLCIFMNFGCNFEENFTSLEEKVTRVVETLPHTPIGGYGVNFSFEVQQPAESLVESFDTTDHIKTEYIVKREKHSLALEFKEGVTLNLSKENLKDRVILNFNYHHEKFDLNSFKEQSGGIVFNFFNKTLDILKSCYEVDVDEINVLRHSPKEA